MQELVQGIAIGLHTPGGLLQPLGALRCLGGLGATELVDVVLCGMPTRKLLQPGGRIALKGTPAEVFEQAAAMAKSNIRPPILAELFARLREADPSAPHPALTVDDAVEALNAWKRG